MSLLIELCNSSVVISGILLSSLISCSKSSLFVLVESFVEFSEGIGNPFSRCDAFSFVDLYFCDEYSLLCCFDPRDISDTFELFKDSLDVLLSLHSFFFSDAFFKRLLRSFSRCFSSLGVLDESQDFSIFVQELFTLFCCCRCGPLCFFVVVLELARVTAGMEHDRTCLFNLMRNLCTKMFF